MSNEVEALVLQGEALRLEIRAAVDSVLANLLATRGQLKDTNMDTVDALRYEADLLSEKAQRISRGDWSLGGTG